MAPTTPVCAADVRVVGALKGDGLLNKGRMELEGSSFVEVRQCNTFSTKMKQIPCLRLYSETNNGNGAKLHSPFGE